MAYGGDPAGSQSDAVRLLIGDTAATALLTDAEILWFISEHGATYRAAAAAARQLAAKYAGKATDKTVGDLSLNYAERQKHYLTLAARLDREATARGGAIFAGGISQADKETREADTDRVKPAFTREDMRNQDAGDADWREDDGS